MTPAILIQDYTDVKIVQCT